MFTNNVQLFGHLGFTCSQITFGRCLLPNTKAQQGGLVFRRTSRMFLQHRLRLAVRCRQSSSTNELCVVSREITKSVSIKPMRPAAYDPKRIVSRSSSLVFSNFFPNVSSSPINLEIISFSSLAIWRYRNVCLDIFAFTDSLMIERIPSSFSG